ncbi:MAG: hypothetical protein JKY24_07870 [Pseudomonadales bacterium]|nr:hypothetical protein [Pseudomonadales bacterium]
MRQSTEDALVDMSNLLAEIVAQDFIANQINRQNFSSSMNRFLERSYRAKIASVDKPASSIRVYWSCTVFLDDKKGEPSVIN